MFKTPESRTALRAALSAVMAGLAAASGVWIGNPYISIATSVVGAIAVWYGVGAATPTEPFLGASDGKVEVPADKVTPVG